MKYRNDPSKLFFTITLFDWNFDENSKRFFIVNLYLRFFKVCEFCEKIKHSVIL